MMEETPSEGRRCERPQASGSTEMRVRLATDADKKDWDAYVMGHKCIPPLNRYAWKGILEDSYGVRTFFFIAEEEDGSVCGVLPTYVIRDLAGDARVYSPKFALLADRDDIAEGLLLHLRRFCIQHGMVSGLVHTGYAALETSFPKSVRTNQVMELVGDEKDQWHGLRSKTRNMIRKAQQSDVTVERGFANLTEFYRVYCANAMELGVPVHSARFFENIADRLGVGSELTVAKRGDMVIGGILVVFSADVAIYPFHSSLPGYHRFAPNQLLLWEVIKRCIERHIPVLDMGESTAGGNVHRFKKNFGGTDRVVSYVSWPSSPELNGSMMRAVKRKALGRPLSLAAKTVSRRSPTWVRKRVGPWVKARGRIL